VATEAQTLANRLNSLKSTGPKSKDGKDASRFNALKHGLTAASADVLGDEDVALFEERADAYRRRYKPADAHEEELVGRMALDDLRSERCRVLYAVLINRHAGRACDAWDLDRRAEAEELATRLPRDPGRVSAALRATRHGCELMIERWEALGVIIGHAGGWDEAQRSMALDLLGVHPALRVGPTAADAPEGTDPVAFGVALAGSEVARLHGLKAGRLDDWDDSERELAEKGLGAELSREMMLLHRYESQIYRRFDAAHRHFLKRDRDGGAPEGTAPAGTGAGSGATQFHPDPRTNDVSDCLTRVSLAAAVPDDPPLDPEPFPAFAPDDLVLMGYRTPLTSERLRESARR
jgi:hypothetical protein